MVRKGVFVFTGLDYWTKLTFELVLLSMKKIAVVLLANLRIWGKLSGYLAKIQVSLKSYVLYTYPEDILISDAGL